MELRLWPSSVQLSQLITLILPHSPLLLEIGHGDSSTSYTPQIPTAGTLGIFKSDRLPVVL